MAQIKVPTIHIGASAKAQIILPYDFASCIDITAEIVSMTQDEHVISKSKKVSIMGYKTLLPDPTNSKAFWVYVEDNESKNAFEGVYLCRFECIIPDTSYPSGQRTEKYEVPFFNFV